MEPQRLAHLGPERLGLARLEELTVALRQSLEQCTADPDVDPVHDTRTGTRRIEAALEAALRDAAPQAGDGGDALTKAVRAWERLLKTIRRAAAPVRDLDVQRKLLKKLVPCVETKATAPVDEPEGAMAGQVGKLDDALHDARRDHAASLKKNAAKWAAKLDGHLKAFAAAQRPTSRRRKSDAAAMALDAFARLASRMRQLDAGDLHDFRKGAKKARYMAEAGGEDERAGVVGKALKKLQDAIGDWHDWLLLAEEAHRFLDKDGAGLTAEIERMRDSHFEMAMKMEGKMRGRLMGEWLASDGAYAAGGARRTGHASSAQTRPGILKKNRIS
ncbi:MAG: CHAD domain-containing protein [Silvibacterium sp.]